MKLIANWVCSKARAAGLLLDPRNQPWGGKTVKHDMNRVMSKLCLSNKDDHPDAAGKHLNDALVLNHARHFDGAAYLAGYVMECALKTIVVLEAGMQKGESTARALGHKLSRLSDEALRLHSLPSSKTARYAPKSIRSLSILDKKFGWRAERRYQAPGLISEQTAHVWLEEVKSVYESTIVKMRRDGVI